MCLEASSLVAIRQVFPQMIAHMTSRLFDIRFNWIIAIFIFLPAQANAAAPAQPNILFIMIDDLGWMDLRCQGNNRLHTPNIDRLAAQGMRFTDAYAAAPVCSPTRAAVLTGLAPARLQITNHIPDQKRFTPKDAKLLPAAMLNHLPVEHVTIAERLKAAGYATGFFGKWHLAGPRLPKKQGMGDMRFYPERQGFDINLGGCAMGGPFSFFDPYNLHNLADCRKGQYMPDRFADEVIEFMRANQEKPFLGFLWNYTVHWPMEAPKALIEKYQKRKDLGRLDPRYAAMIEAMDASNGRILAEIDKLRLRDNTLVVFTSDNGAFGGVSDLAPLRAAKGFLYEGGIRVPLIARWPGVVPAGTLNRDPVISMDFFPTMLETANLTSDDEAPLDGESLIPLLRQSGKLKRSAIYFHYPNYAFHGGNRLGSAMRQGDFKLIERFDDGSIELYNLKDDIGEKSNLASDMPDRAAAMQKDLKAWRATTGAAMPTPRP
jgi:arylsulfatase A-like enzyme